MFSSKLAIKPNQPTVAKAVCDVTIAKGFEAATCEGSQHIETANTVNFRLTYVRKLKAVLAPVIR
jgi:hypothetical protein